MKGAVMSPAPCRRRSRPAGFTLIELLVVIAIISLLVSILLPSLNQAKELARQAVCAANLHHVGAAVAIYANEFDGHIPPQWSHDDRTILPSVTYMAYWEGGWPVVNGQRAYFNLSPLEFGGYVPTGKMFYCPSQSVEAEYAWESTDRYGTSFHSMWEGLTHQERLDQAVYIRTSYTYNPQSDGGWTTAPYKRLAEFPMDRALGLDVLFDQWRVAHSDAPGWSLLFADIHVEFKTVPDIYDRLGDVGQVGDSWGLFGTFVEDLERH